MGEPLIEVALTDLQFKAVPRDETIYGNLLVRELFRGVHVPRVLDYESRLGTPCTRSSSSLFVHRRRTYKLQCLSLTDTDTETRELSHTFVNIFELLSLPIHLFR